MWRSQQVAREHEEDRDAGVQARRHGASQPLLGRPRLERDVSDQHCERCQSAQGVQGRLVVCAEHAQSRPLPLGLGPPAPAHGWLGAGMRWPTVILSTQTATPGLVPLSTTTPPPAAIVK